MKTCHKLLALCLPISMVLSACQEKTSAPSEVTDNFEQVYQAMSVDDLKTHIKTLSSDEFEGRLPTTVGEEKTLDYLVKEFKQLGYEPGNGDSYVQDVPLMSSTVIKQTHPHDQR